MGDNYLNISVTSRNSEVLRKYSEVWNGIKDCIEKINDSEVGKYSKDYMKIKFNPDDDVPLIVQNLDDFLILKIKKVGYRFCVVNMGKKDAISLLNNSALDNKGVL